MDCYELDERVRTLSPALHSPRLDTIVIQRSGFRPWPDWAELWQYRYLFVILTLRDIKVRYKQTVLGASWALLQPLSTTVVLTLIFGRLAELNQKIGDVPYSLHLLIGLLPWTFFSGVVSTATQSLIANAPLITKVYFPRFLVPLSSVGVTVVDLCVSSLLLVVLMLQHQTPLHWHLALAPIFFAGAALAALGVGSFLGGLVAIYRDFRHVMPVMLQLWFFLTPVVYPVTLLPAPWQALSFLNPLTGVVEGLRAVLLGRAVAWPGVAVSLAVCVVLFIAGSAGFRLLERRIADVI